MWELANLEISKLVNGGGQKGLIDSPNLPKKLDDIVNYKKLRVWF